MFLQDHNGRIVFVTESMSTLQEVQLGLALFMGPGWTSSSRATLNGSPVSSDLVIHELFGNKRVGVLARAAIIDNNLTLNQTTVLQCAQDIVLSAEHKLHRRLYLFSNRYR